MTNRTSTPDADTQPPGTFAAPEPPPGAYTDSAVVELLATARRLETHYKELLNPEGILERHRFEIARLIDANYGLIHEHVKAMGETVRVLHSTVGQHSQRFEGLDEELAAIRLRLTAIERWREALATPTG